MSGGFWVPEPSADDQKVDFLLVKHPLEKPRQPFITNPDLAMQYATSAGILIVGAVLLFSGTSATLRAYFAAVFLTATVIPFTAILLDFIRLRGDVRVILQMQNIPLFIFLMISLSLDVNQEWKSSIGSPLFEAGLVYWVYKALFFTKAPEDEVLELRERVKELEQSVAIGLADGYYYNYVVHTARALQTNPTFVEAVDDRKAPEPGAHAAEERRERIIDPPTLFVVVPMVIDASVTDFDVVVRQFQAIAKLVRGNVKSSFYRQTLFDLPLRSILFDIPTPLNVLIKQRTLGQGGEMSIEHILVEREYHEKQYRQEIHLFSQRLSWLCQQGNTPGVQIILLRDTDIKKFEEAIHASLQWCTDDNERTNQTAGLM